MRPGGEGEINRTSWRDGLISRICPNQAVLRSKEQEQMTEEIDLEDEDGGKAERKDSIIQS